MVLKTLESMGPLHGYGIARRIEQTSGHLLSLNYGTLYPALPRVPSGVLLSRPAGSRDRRSHGAWRRTAAIYRLVLRQGLLPVLLGLAAGLVVSLGSLLYGVSGRDPLTMTAVAALMLLVAAAAIHLPARRARRIDPMSALREQLGVRRRRS